MKVVILHDRIGEDARTDERDALVQAEAVSRALVELGHEPGTAQFSLDLRVVADELRRSRPDLVFNLVESVESRGSLIHLAPALLDSLNIAFTGAPTEAMFLTSNKLLAKQLLAANGVATPPWFMTASLAGYACLEAPGTKVVPVSSPAARPQAGDGKSEKTPPRAPVALSSRGPPGASESHHAACISGRYIIKSVWEHASVGLDEGAVVEIDQPEVLLEKLRSREGSLGGRAFAERYIDGREFNLSVLAGDGGAEVMPHAEIRFVDYGRDRLKIVGYAAKWDEQSFEYSHTPRSFDFPPEDIVLLNELSRIARQCWTIFGLR
jgi:D-alanine-D-alanine ligase